MRLLFICLLLLSGHVFAQRSENATPLETSKTFGEYLVLYNAFPSMTLPAAMAANYRIERNDNTAFINITVLKRGSTPQPARVSGTYGDLINTRPLAFREIREQNSISYIAQVRYHNREVLRFDIKVEPQVDAGEAAPIGAPFAVSFTRKFFTDQ